MIEFILITAGLSYGLTKSTLFEKTREDIRFKYLNKGGALWWTFYHVSKCPLCMGFYAAIPAYFLVFNRLDVMLAGYMFIGSITSYIIYLIIEKLER